MTAKKLRENLERRERDRGDPELRLIMIYGSIFCVLLVGLSFNALGA